MIRLGTCVDGRMLSYDASLYEFRLGREVVRYSDVRALDAAAHVSWLAMEQRDWFRGLDPELLDACNERALARHGDAAYAGMTPEERVKADAARDDSVLAGKIVDADPALVHAVVNALEEQGLLGGVLQPGAPVAVNPLAAVGLPKGMEALSQFERAQDGERKMTRAEQRLMQKILRNDDKEKARREKEAERLGRERAKQRLAEEEAAESANERPAPQKSRIVSDAMNVVAANPEHHRFSSVTSGEQADAEAASHGYNADVAQTALAVSVEEQALREMRERNKRENDQAAAQAAGIPGAKKRSAVSRFGRNVDGSPKGRG